MTLRLPLSCRAGSLVLLALLLLSSPLALRASGPSEPSDYGVSSLSGLVLRFSPGAYMVIATEGTEPTVFMDPHVSYVNPKGQKAEAKDVVVGKRVKLSYVRQGPDILVTQVTLAD